MITIKKARGALLAATVAVVAGASLSASISPAHASPAQRPTTAPASGNVSHANTLTPQVRALVKGSGATAEGNAVASYWTAARMRAAQSLDQKVSGQLPSSSLAATPQGKTTAIKGSAPTTTPQAKGSVNAPSYTYPNLPYYHPTARTVGKVFFSRTLNGLTYNFVCSGAIVNTNGKRTVWTAGHCVYGPYNGGSGTKVWDSNFTFVPSYSNGAAPYGYWSSAQLWTTSAWYNNQDLCQDNGAVITNLNNGNRIANYLGSQGLMWNASANYYADAFGYPQGSPFNGAYLVKASGNTASAGCAIYMFSGMTGGSSGGPWLRGYNGSYGYINGHNDFIYTNNPNYMYSPYYGNQVASLYNSVVGAGG